MKKLRSFVYLDNYKMYSISSQLFEGLTEYIVKSEGKKTKEEESQKGPIGSGRILADIIEKDVNQSEKKFLHDYSYNLFEDALINENRVLELDKFNIQDNISEINDFSFVKISGNVVFNDLKIIEETLTNFNRIGEAFGYISNKSMDGLEKVEISKTINSITDRNKKAKANSILNSKSDFKKMLIEQGLNMDEEYLKNLAYVLNFGYNKQFEVQIPIKSMDNDTFQLFSAQLKRENLKEDEYSIIKKYSRQTEKQFKLFGILTQKLNKESKRKIFENVKESNRNDERVMKEILTDVVSVFSNLENTFIGKLDYEYVIDPIALYLEI